LDVPFEPSCPGCMSIGGCAFRFEVFVTEAGFLRNIRTLNFGTIGPESVESPKDGESFGLRRVASN